MLLVIADGDHLGVEPPDAAWQRPLTEFLGEFLSALVVKPVQAPAVRIARPATDLRRHDRRTRELVGPRS